MPLLEQRLLLSSFSISDFGPGESYALVLKTCNKKVIKSLKRTVKIPTNKNVCQFLHCQNSLEINDSLFISGLFDIIYVNKFSHFGQNGNFKSDNIALVIPDEKLYY